MSFDSNPLPVHLEGNFLIQIPGMQDLKFEKSSALKSTIKQIKRTFGGEVFERKFPGNVEFADVTLEYAATSDTRLRVWHRQCMDAVNGRGQIDPLYFKDVSHLTLAPDKTTRLERKVMKYAWPNEYEEGENTAENANVVVRKLVLCYWYYEVVAV